MRRMNHYGGALREYFFCDRLSNCTASIVSATSARQMIEVRPSTIRDANDGLWATTDIPVGTVLDISHLKSAASPEHPTTAYVLDGFVRPSIDLTTVCLCDGVITSFADMQITDAMQRPQYFYVEAEELLMKANDFGWDADVQNAAEYARKTERNALELIMKVENGRIVGVCGVTIQPIAKGEEIGITYGDTYWLE